CERTEVTSRGSEQICMNRVRDKNEVAAGIPIPIQKNRFAFYQCCDPLWDDRSVIPFRVLARSKNVEVTKTDCFESVALGKDVRIEFVRIFRYCVRRELSANRAFYF